MCDSQQSWPLRLRRHGCGAQARRAARRGRSPLAVPAAVLATALALVPACSGGHLPHRHPPAGRHTLDGPAPRRHGYAGAVPAATASCHPGVNAAEWWILGQRELAVLEELAPVALRHAVNPANLLVLGAPGSPARTGQAVADFKSYATFRRALAAGGIPRSTHWVMYDNERWPPTPVQEQKHPGLYEPLFASLAHRHGLHVILAPGQDLVEAFSTTRFRASIASWRRYLSLGLARTSALAADVYEIQAQPFELPFYRRANIFGRDVSAAVAQARAARPQTAIFVGISTQRAASTPQLLSDFLATRGLAAGYWLNVPGIRNAHQQQIARQFLRQLPAITGAGRTCARPSISGR